MQQVLPESGRLLAIQIKTLTTSGNLMVIVKNLFDNAWGKQFYSL